MPAHFRRRSARFAPASVNGAAAPATGHGPVADRPLASDAVASTVVWVYAVVADLDPGQLSGLTGVGGEPVRALAESGLSAVVGSVDGGGRGGGGAGGAFGEGSLTNLLADLGTIETIGREHHQVVASVAAGGLVVPLRLATVYPEDETVRRLLVEHRADLAELLRFFSGTQEWGVKVFMELTADAGQDHLCAASSGAQDRRPGPEPRWQKAEACAAEIDRALCSVAIAARRHPASYLRSEDSDGLMVLNGVYLLDADRAAEFTGTAQKPGRGACRAAGPGDRSLAALLVRGPPRCLTAFPGRPAARPSAAATIAGLPVRTSGVCIVSRRTRGQFPQATAPQVVRGEATEWHPHTWWRWIFLPGEPANNGRENLLAMLDQLVSEVRPGQIPSWENVTLSGYLAALAAWLNVYERAYRDVGRPIPQDVWEIMAVAFRAATIYG